MNFNISLLMPEFFQTGIFLLLFLQTLVKVKSKVISITTARDIFLDWLPLAAMLGLGISIISLTCQGKLFLGVYQIDGLSQFFKFIIATGFFIATYNAINQPAIDSNRKIDYFMLMALSALGLMLLASSVELITIYLALEISSYSLFAIIPLRRNDKRAAAEAAIKYILFGAVATSVALYGLALILASHHSSYLTILAHKNWDWQIMPLAVIGLVMFIIGFLYKLALFPFHFWCPDVYDGASNETAAYIATLPKIGVIVILIRLVAILKSGSEIVTILAIFAAFSITFGNLAALIQKDLKRILGYSSIAHAGYIIIGLVAGNVKGLASAIFYGLAYLLMNFTIFWVICRLSIDGRNLSLDDLNGLYQRAPILAFVLAIAVFALVGFPPTAGFIGKLFLLGAAWGQGYNWLIIIAAINTAISIYYYLKIIRHAYTIEYHEKFYSLRGNSVFFGFILACIILILGIIPAPIIRLAETIALPLLSNFK